MNIPNEPGPNDADSTPVRCPMCQFDYTHVRSAATVPSHDNYEAGWWGRGDLIVVSMYCEEGHKFELCLGFHKGQNYLFTRNGKKMTRKEWEAQP